MPFAFEDSPGLAGDNLRRARRLHDVQLTGPSVALSTMVPAFKPIMHADGSASILLRQAQWLLLGIICPGGDVDPDALLVDVIIHVNRLGVAFDRLVQGQLDTTACSPSVARARVKTLGMKLMLVDPAPFTARAADLYHTIQDRALGYTRPAEARVALLSFRVGPSVQGTTRIG